MFVCSDTVASVKKPDLFEATSFISYRIHLISVTSAKVAEASSMP
jgi:hypothetical protein